jgi:hypothetical protein
LPANVDQPAPQRAGSFVVNDNALRVNNTLDVSADVAEQAAMPFQGARSLV